jgi:hypothetical protein
MSSSPGLEGMTCEKFQRSSLVTIIRIRPGIYTTICGNTLQEIHFKKSKNTVANRNHTDVFFGATSINTLQGIIKYTSFITKNLSSLIQIHTVGVNVESTCSVPIIFFFLLPYLQDG